MSSHLKTVNLTFSMLHSRAAGVVEADAKLVCIYLAAKQSLVFFSSEHIQGNCLRHHI